MLNRRLGVALAAAAVTAGVASCGGGGGHKVAITKPPAGHGSPAAAVVGFFTDFVASNRDACTFVLSSQALDCLLTLNNSTATLTGFGIGETTTRGAEALVTFVGKFCLTASKSTTCRSNTNPTVGQPSGNSQKAFDKLYQPAQQGRAVNHSAIPCEKIGTEWYISLG